LRQRDRAAFWRGLQSAGGWQIHKAGWRLIPQVVGDMFGLWRKKRRGRIKYVFDV
jgi:hypothetical protein